MVTAKSQSGLIVYLFCRSLIPVVLAQLLLQFQQPVAPGGTNSTSLSAEDASAVSTTSSELPIIKRSISDGLRDFRNNFGEYENLGVFSLVSDIENGEIFVHLFIYRAAR